ncbi:MAG: hypothetical protein A2X99_05570 [Deltaproteobacteria bacterium GWB2_55_19]|nr:MAG: hypothetical protein A2X99_05570 [Deltaproteobacteria bacterium GWB2_55_19]
MLFSRVFIAKCFIIAPYANNLGTIAMQVNDPKGVNAPVLKDFQAPPNAEKISVKEISSLTDLLASLLKGHPPSQDIQQQIKSTIAVLMARLVEGSITVDGLLRLLKASGVDLKLFTGEVESFLSQILSPEELKEALKAMQDDGLKGLMKYLSSRAHGKGEGAETPAGPKVQDVVSLTKGIDAIFKSLGLKEGVAATPLNIPGGAESPLFAMLIAEGITPGLALKLKKLYSRRPKGGKGGKDKDRQNETHKAYDNPTVTIESEGEIKTADGKRAHCVILMELDTGAKDLSPAKITLAPVEIDYGGAAEDLKDLSFSFDIERASGSSSGHGRALIIIDLIEVGTDENGAPIYGVGEDEGWGEEGV